MQWGKPDMKRGRDLQPQLLNRPKKTKMTTYDLKISVKLCYACYAIDTRNYLCTECNVYLYGVIFETKVFG